MPIRKKQSGFTLMELIIALFIAVVVMAGVMALFFNMIKQSRTTVEAGRLDRELHSVLNVMAADIRRAGYWAQAETSNVNPFMVTGTTDIFVNVAQNCILLTYDNDADGAVAAIAGGSDDEHYGYRLSGSAIQYRPWGAAYDCTANDWEDLTDPNVVNITAFQVVKNEDDVDLDGAGAGTAKMTLRSVTITITGELVNDTSISKTLTQTVKVYNDKYSP